MDFCHRFGSPIHSRVTQSLLAKMHELMTFRICVDAEMPPIVIYYNQRVFVKIFIEITCVLAAGFRKRFCIYSRYSCVGNYLHRLSQIEFNWKP